MSGMKLPVLLERLSPEARSWVISAAAERGVSPETVAREAVEAAAARDGFVVTAPEMTTNKEGLK